MDIEEFILYWLLTWGDDWMTWNEITGHPELCKFYMYNNILDCGNGQSEPIAYHKSLPQIPWIFYREKNGVSSGYWEARINKDYLK